MDNKSQQVETAVWRLTNGRHREQLEKEAAQAGDAGELHLVLGMLVDERMFISRRASLRPVARGTLVSCTAICLNLHFPSLARSPAGQEDP